MKNKRMFSLSKALITENLKMYWYLPALSFIAYFMAGIFPLIMDSSLRTDPNRTYLEDSLNNMNFFFGLLLVAAPRAQISGISLKSALEMGSSFRKQVG